MTRESSKVEILALTLQVVDRQGDRFQVRATLQGPGLNASVGTSLSKDEVEDLLHQIERQYGDFQAPVSWETRATSGVSLAWRLDPSGHLEGRAEVRDPTEGWSASVRLKGDQSYLPQAALGLRLLIR